VKSTSAKSSHYSSLSIYKYGYTHIYTTFTGGSLPFHYLPFHYLPFHYLPSFGMEFTVRHRITFPAQHSVLNTSSVYSEPVTQP